MFDVITFGSAIEDNFLDLKKESYSLKGGRKGEEKSICFTLGDKFFLNGFNSFSGGGGTNSACTFANQGFKTAYVGKVGDDRSGRGIIEELKRFGVKTEFVKKDKKQATAHSFIFSSEQEGRTILIQRGACHWLKKNDIPWGKIKGAGFFYLAPLSGDSARVFPDIVRFAKRNNIRMAANLGNSQIGLGRKTLKPLLKELEVLILNTEEAFLLTGISWERKNKVIKELGSLGADIVVLTNGEKGSLVIRKKTIFEAGIIPVHPVKETGAGDAFGSGFVSGLLKKNNVEYAMKLAVLNAANCIKEIGAKNGLLKKNSKLYLNKVKIKKRLF